MSGVLRLVLFQARRDRVALPVWILGITLLSFATSAAVATQFGDEAGQAAPDHLPTRPIAIQSRREP